MTVESVEPVIDPAVKETEKEIEKVEKEAEKVIEKIEDPNTSSAERIKLMESVDKLNARLDSHEAKLDKLLASPIAPSPRKTEETVQPPAVDTPAKPKAKSKVSKGWFGSHADE